MKKVELSENILSAYDDQYNDELTNWREIGGKYKAQNIVDLTEGKSFKKVLDFGAGEGSILKFLDSIDSFEELYALEISQSGIDQIIQRKLDKIKDVKKFDGYQTEYSNDEFDLVYCSHVIEHVEHPRIVLREIKRISKYQIFEVPLDYSKNVDNKMEHFLSYGHINIFTPSLFKFLLKSEGFEIIKEIHKNTAKEVIEFNWYKNLKLKKTLVRRVLSNLASNKSKIIGLLLGKAVANENFNSSYSCLSKKSGDLNIF